MKKKMKAKNYLITHAFKVSCPNQTWGTREEQLLIINRITVNYSTIKYNFISGVIDRLTEDRTMLQGFDNWSHLIDAINIFMNDVELHYPITQIIRSGYDGDISSDDDIEMGKRFPRMIV